jgi:mannosyl-3-phosphoglycerate phosphatase family protein
VYSTFLREIQRRADTTIRALLLECGKGLEERHVTVGSIRSSWWPPSVRHTSPWTGLTQSWHERMKELRDAHRQIIVFTDPDGTLLEHRTHPCVPHCEALRLVSDREVPIVLCSSRTRAELELVQQEFHFRHPFISENGGAVYVPRGYFSSSDPAEVSGYHVLAFGGPHQHVVDALRRTAAALGIDVRGFNGMSVEEVANECGLSLADARLAQLREYDEPFRIVASDAAVQSRLLNGLRRVGLRCVDRGAFHHVAFGADVGRALRAVASLYRQQRGDIFTVGVASGLTNDSSLLREVDLPIIVRNPQVDVSRVLRKVSMARVTTKPGALGWDEAILSAVKPELQNVTERR